MDRRPLHFPLTLAWFSSPAWSSTTVAAPPHPRGHQHLRALLACLPASPASPTSSAHPSPSSAPPHRANRNRSSVGRRGLHRRLRRHQRFPSPHVAFIVLPVSLRTFPLFSRWFPSS